MTTNMMIVSFDIGEKNFAYAIGDKDTLVTWRCVDLTNGRKGATFERSCDAATELLNDAAALLDSCDKAIVERQMRNNTRAQRLSQHVWTWFRLMRPNLDVEFVPSTLKTSHFLSNNERRRLTDKTRKRWARNKVTDILTERGDEANMAYGRSLKKMDDVADSYLQLMAYDDRRRRRLS